MTPFSVPVIVRQTGKGFDERLTIPLRRVSATDLPAPPGDNDHQEQSCGKGRGTTIGHRWPAKGTDLLFGSYHTEDGAGDYDSSRLTASFTSSTQGRLR